MAQMCELGCHTSLRSLPMHLSRFETPSYTRKFLYYYLLLKALKYIFFIELIIKNGFENLMFHYNNKISEFILKNKNIIKNCIFVSS